MTAMWKKKIVGENLSDETRQFLQNISEIEEQSCRNKRYSGMSCKVYCAHYNTEKCLHPEEVFPRKN